MACFTVKLSEFKDIKHALTLDLEKGNVTQSKIKQLKGSKSAYLGHIIKTFSGIKHLMSEPNKREMVICLQDQQDNLVRKLKAVLDTLVELLDSLQEVSFTMNFISNRKNKLSI